jgi:hypothetical protein
MATLNRTTAPGLERRTRRSTNPGEAVRYYLDALCEKEQLEAVALSTGEGLLIAGAGRLDFEWMAAVGPTSKRAFFKWEDRTLHVQQFDVDGSAVFLTSAGRHVPGATCARTINRILRG